jgi:antitoxin MazE
MRFDNCDARIYNVDTMRTRVQKWGNSLAVRLPRQVAEAAGLGENVEVEVTASGEGVAITPVTRELTLDDLLAGITSKNRHDATEWDGPRGREAW